jgi:hypothetical protein
VCVQQREEEEETAACIPKIDLHSTMGCCKIVLFTAGVLFRLDESTSCLQIINKKNFTAAETCFFQSLDVPAISLRCTI